MGDEKVRLRTPFSLDLVLGHRVEGWVKKTAHNPTWRAQCGRSTPRWY